MVSLTEKKKQPLIPHGGGQKGDLVMTPPELAKQIIDHFKPSGDILDPCKGDGAFCDQIPNCHWCEITQGRDFFTTTGDYYDWIITNPPWSQFRAFLNKSMEVADNVVFLSTINHWFLTGRLGDLKKNDFGIVEICRVKTPVRPWPQSGFALAAVWIKRGWHGGINFSP